MSKKMSKQDYENYRQQLQLTDAELDLIIDNRATAKTDDVKHIILFIITRNVGTYKTWLLTADSQNNFRFFVEYYIPLTPNFISDSALKTLNKQGIDVHTDDFKRLIYFGINAALTAIERTVDTEEQTLYDQVKKALLR